MPSYMVDEVYVCCSNSRYIVHAITSLMQNHLA